MSLRVGSLVGSRARGGDWKRWAGTSAALRVHRGQTSRAVFRFISRHFIHREVET